MKQSRLMSWVETLLSTAIGFVVAILAQIAIFPLFGFHPPLSHNLMIGALFTVVSVIRGFCVRRLFEALQIRAPLPASVLAIAAERRRQVEVEGWTPEHDDEHKSGELALAGACYALAVASRNLREAGVTTAANHIDVAIGWLWPWDKDWWKPQDNRRDLVRSGALGVAELDKMDRARKRKAVRG
ncbi:hypothetical protein AFEL58S_02070 [Afipia felis]